MTVLLKTSTYLLKDKFVAIIVDFRPVLIYSFANKISAPSLSEEIYPNSSKIIRTYFSNFSKLT